MSDENGDAIVRRSSRGWALDADGWWTRPYGRRDSLARAAMSRAFLPRLDCHAFFENNMIFCRNARQKRAIDSAKAGA